MSTPATRPGPSTPAPGGRGRAVNPSGRPASTQHRAGAGGGSGRRAPASRPQQAPILLGAVLILVSAVLGGLAAAVWHGVATLPTYHVADDGSASTTERGLTQMISTDSTYGLIGLVVGAICALAAWWLFSRRGSVVVLIAGLASLVAALVCWWIGVLIGPGSFATRIAGAKPGDDVQVDFHLHTWTPILLWIAGAMVALLVCSLVVTIRARRAASQPAAGDDEERRDDQ